MKKLKVLAPKRQILQGAATQVIAEVTDDGKGIPLQSVRFFVQKGGIMVPPVVLTDEDGRAGSYYINVDEDEFVADIRVEVI